MARELKMLTHQQLKARVLERADVKREYNALEAEFAALDKSLNSRAAAQANQIRRSAKKHSSRP